MSRENIEIEFSIMTAGLMARFLSMAIHLGATFNCFSYEKLVRDGIERLFSDEPWGIEISEDHFDGMRLGTLYVYPGIKPDLPVDPRFERKTFGDFLEHTLRTISGSMGLPFPRRCREHLGMLAQIAVVRAEVRGEGVRS